MCGYKCMLCFVVVVGLLAFASQTPAATLIFQDDFQSDEARSYNLETDRNPVIGDGDIGGSWSIAESEPTRVMVVDDNVPRNAGSGSGENHYLQIKNDVSDPPGAYATAVLANPISHEISLSFKHYFRWGGSSVDWSANLMDGSNLLFGLKMMYDGTDPPIAAPIAYTDAIGDHVLTGLTYSDAAWVTMSATINTDTNAFSVSVGGGTPVTGTYSNTLGQASSVVFGGGMYTNTYIDDVSISGTPTPEPSSMLLMVVGVFGLLAYAWRKRK